MQIILLDVADMAGIECWINGIIWRAAFNSSPCMRNAIPPWSCSPVSIWGLPLDHLGSLHLRHARLCLVQGASIPQSMWPFTGKLIAEVKSRKHAIPTALLQHYVVIKGGVLWPSRECRLMETWHAHVLIFHLVLILLYSHHALPAYLRIGYNPDVGCGNGQQYSCL